MASLMPKTLFSTLGYTSQLTNFPVPEYSPDKVAKTAYKK